MDHRAVTEPSREFRKVLKYVLKEEIHFLLQRLSEAGEETVVLTASQTDDINGHLASSVGEGFLKTANRNLTEIKKDFVAYCKGSREKHVRPTHTLECSQSHHHVTSSTSQAYHREAPRGGGGGGEEHRREVHRDVIDLTDQVKPTAAAPQTYTGSKKSTVQSVPMTKQTLPVFETVFGEKQMKSLHATDHGALEFNDKTQTQAKHLADNSFPRTSETFNLQPGRVGQYSKAVLHNDDQSKVLWMDYIEENQSINPNKKQISLESCHSDLPCHSTVQRDRTLGSKDHIGMKVPHTISTNDSLADTGQKSSNFSQDIIHEAFTQSICDPNQKIFDTEVSAALSEMKVPLQYPNNLPSFKNVHIHSCERQGKAAPQITRDREKNINGAGQDLDTDVETLADVTEMDTKENFRNCPQSNNTSASLKLLHQPPQPQFSHTTSISEKQSAQSSSYHSDAHEIIQDTGFKSANFKSTPTRTKQQVKLPNRTSATSFSDSVSTMSLEMMFEIHGTMATCVLCGKIVLSRNRRYHWLFHTGQKPYECDFCGKRFAHPSNLKTHSLTHKQFHFSSEISSNHQDNNGKMT